MKKILSLVLAVLMLSSMFTATALASGDLFDVEFNQLTNRFIVSGSNGLVGINRVLLVVKNDAGNVVYMDAINNNESFQDVYFEIDLGDSLEAAEYTFILSSEGVTRSSQTKTCAAEFEREADFFDVVYNEERNSFLVTGEITKQDGTSSVNNILLMVYDPMFNGQSDLYYMDALNAHKGSFSFEVPVNAMAQAGSYTFLISSSGEVVTDGVKNCSIVDNFETFGSIANGTTFGATYTLKSGETAPSVIIALYKTDSEGNKTLVRTVISNTVSEGKVTSQISIGADEDVSSYSAKAFVWESMTTLVPVKAARSF